MEQDAFKFHIQNLSFGWCRVLMLINDKEISFNAEYMGRNLFFFFFFACAYLMEEGGEYAVKWLYHDFVLIINMVLDDNAVLSFDIEETERDYSSKEDKDVLIDEWHETIPFESFVKAVKTEGIRVLNAFGLYGYYRSWMDDEEFPLTGLLRIVGNNNEDFKGDSCCSDINDEINKMKELINDLYIKEETNMSECTIYYESWQLQCCGDPFSVGDTVEWTCIMPTEYKNAHGIILDFEEEHHGFATHRIKGIVSNILAERSEFPKGEREVWYNKAKTIKEELQHADGWESEIKDDEVTERTFWGYVVELKDVTVKPLKDKQ